MNMTLSELKEEIVKLYDPDDIVESLELTTEDLINAFEEKLVENIHKFSEEEDDDLLFT